MSAFSAAIDAIFTDPNMAADAVWQEQRIGPATTVRAILRRPDDLTEFGDARILSEITLVDVRVSELPLPRSGDRLTLGADRFVIQGTPRRDRERLVWSIDLRPE